MTTIENEVQANVLAMFNASDLYITGTHFGKYEIYGMFIRESAIEYGISLSYYYLEELLGTAKMDLVANRHKIVACCTDMASLRIWGTLAGVSIPTHFSYTDGKLTITKNVHPMLEANIELLLKSIRQWIKMLMSDNWTAVNLQDDLAFTSLIHDNELGYDRITHDVLL